MLFTDEQKAEILKLIAEATKTTDPPAPAPADPPTDPPAPAPADPPTDPPAPAPADPLKAENERLKNQIDALSKLVAAAGIAAPDTDKEKKATVEKVANYIKNL